MKKILLTFGIILLVGTIFAFTQINHSIELDKTEKNTLTNIGITNPLISSCIKIDEFTCKANVFEKDGINKDIEITIKYCKEWSNNTEEIENFTSDCLKWKELTQLEIETEMKDKTEKLLKNIANIQISRNHVKEVLTDEINIEIKS